MQNRLILLKNVMVAAMLGIANYISLMRTGENPFKD